MRERLIWITLLQFAFPVAAAQLPPTPKETAAPQRYAPQLFVAQRSQDLGTVQEGDKRLARWLIENRGDADLVINRTRSSCGCAVVRLGDKEKVILPGGSVDFKVEFDSRGRSGKQVKQVTIFSNDPTDPELNLEFTADVSFLYAIKPDNLVNLQSVQRGGRSPKTIDVHPGPGRKSVEILDIQVPKDVPLRFEHEPFKAGEGMGQKIHVVVGESASLGIISADATIRLKVDDIERERVVTLRGEVVGDLTWRPKLIDATNQTSLRGRQFAPVTVESAGDAPFEVIAATAGPLFDVEVRPAGNPQKRTKYLIVLTLRDDAPAGPFGAMLELRTSSLDQPVAQVPVFGIAAAPIEVDPPLVLLRQDGTDVGERRRVRLQVIPQLRLNVSEVTCDSNAVVAEVDREASSRYSHIALLNVRLARKLPVGAHQAVLTVVTDIEGAERLEIPVSIDVPQ